MAGNDATTLPFKPGRRNFLYGVTAAVGAAGLAVAAWPFIHQMNPDAEAQARGDWIETDAAPGPSAGPRVVKWRPWPVFVLWRTPAMIAALSDAALVSALKDPQSQARQQPDYARNAHRLIDPALGVMVGVCTYCSCIPKFFAEDAQTADAFICPCCASRYDVAGRAARGPAQYNLPVPPHSMRDRRLVIGRNPPGETFSFGSIERI